MVKTPLRVQSDSRLPPFPKGGTHSTRLQVWGVFAFLLLASPAFSASRADDLFQSALVKETIERDPQGAVLLYQKILDQPEASRADSSKARLRQGICYEKLGKSTEAEVSFRQLLTDPSGIPSDILQEARTHVRRIEFNRRMVMASSVTVRGITQFIPSRYSFLVGPSLRASNRGNSLTGLALGLRYRISSSSRPLNWYLDARGIAPVGEDTVARQNQVFDSQGLDAASLSLQYQASLGILNELPHGKQRTVLPEAGIGLTLTRSKIGYTSASSEGEINQSSVRPYLEAGVHLFPDHIVSLHLDTRYLSSPYPNTVDIPSPAHSQTFNFPKAAWTFTALVQIQLGHREVVLVPK